MKTATHSILAGLLLTVALHAAAGWEKVGDSESATHYIDPASIDRRGSFRRVLELQDFKQKDNYGAMSRQGLVEYDCLNNQRKFLKIDTYSKAMRGGKVIDIAEMEKDHTNWRINQSNSIAESIYKRVCSK
jgi:hypothetical protein